MDVEALVTSLVDRLQRHIPGEVQLRPPCSLTNSPNRTGKTGRAEQREQTWWQGPQSDTARQGISAPLRRHDKASARPNGELMLGPPRPARLDPETHAWLRLRPRCCEPGSCREPR